VLKELPGTAGLPFRARESWANTAKNSRNERRAEDAVARGPNIRVALASVLLLATDRQNLPRQIHPCHECLCPALISSMHYIAPSCRWTASRWTQAMSLLTPTLVRAPRATAIRGISMSVCKTRPRQLDTLPTVLPAGVIPRSYDRMIDVSTKMLRGGGKLSEGLIRMLSRTTRFPDGLYSEPCSCFSEIVVPCGARVSTSPILQRNT
jgi:hypothetical protein